MWAMLVVKPHGSENHECTLLYECDDLLASENAESILANDVGKCFELKEDLTGIPKKKLVPLIIEDLHHKLPSMF